MKAVRQTETSAERASKERPEKRSRSALTLEKPPISSHMLLSALAFKSSISSAESSGILMGPARPPVPQTNL